MDETRPPEFYENLPKEAKKLLRKKFNQIVETRYKIYLWCGIGLLVLAIISGGFSIYYMLHLLLGGEISTQFYICAALFIIEGVAALLISSKYHNKFRTWLKECKNISTKTDMNHNNA